MTLLAAAILLVIMPIGCFAPGYFFVRRFRWNTNERLSASIGLSLVLLYGVATGIYLSGINWNWCWAATAIAIGMAAIAWSDLREFLAQRQVLQQLKWFGFLLLLGLLLLSSILHYSGGDWVADWLGHYQRATYFLRVHPYDPKLFIPDPLPTRPPL